MERGNESRTTMVMPPLQPRNCLRCNGKGVTLKQGGYAGKCELCDGSGQMRPEDQALFIQAEATVRVANALERIADRLDDASDARSIFGKMGAVR